MTRAELQTIADRTAANLDLAIRPTIEVKDVKAGRARLTTGKITIPRWVTRCVREYVIYYVIHEVCHFPDRLRHGDDFKAIELVELEKVGIFPQYAKAYPKTFCNSRGAMLCGPRGQRLRAGRRPAGKRARR